MRTQPAKDAKYTPYTHAPAAATAAVVTLPATTGVTHVLERVQWSYSAAPTGGKLTITVNAVAKLTVHITAAGPGFLDIGPFYGSSGHAVVVTLASGAGSVEGTINVLAR